MDRILEVLGDEMLKWLTYFFNKIFSSTKLPEEWRLSEVFPIYKNNGNVLVCSNYRGIKLLGDTIKIWREKVLDRGYTPPQKSHGEVLRNTKRIASGFP
ncbi:hypothetical protein CTI12_AA530880 [Artemisia annua]|uniref:Uncharacterized protein n=1 Tax=Artemisia annua TaxID=35608 RepID=A0A2U1L4U5_ARTAN|nr:hypothetical protein CTI12_AA530880 [Artemisia annua]